MRDSSFDRLVHLLPPPSGEVAGVPWRRSRPEIGVEFPADFREFADRYGGGSMVRESDGTASLSVYGLYSGEPTWGGETGFRAFMANQVDDIYESFADTPDDFWDGPSYPVHPDPGGLLAWGDNQDGDVFFWLTEDPDPDRWPVVMLARGPAVMMRFESGMVEFLVSVLSGDHPEIDWLTDSPLTWKMTNDWLRRLS